MHTRIEEKVKDADLFTHWKLCIVEIFPIV